MTSMDDCHGQLSWMTFMDDWTLLFISYFDKLLTNRQTCMMQLYIAMQYNELEIGMKYENEANSVNIFIAILLSV